MRMTCCSEVHGAPTTGQSDIDPWVLDAANAALTDEALKLLLDALMHEPGHIAGEAHIGPTIVDPLQAGDSLTVLYTDPPFRSLNRYVQSAGAYIPNPNSCVLW